MWPFGDHLVTTWWPLGYHLVTATRPLPDHPVQHVSLMPLWKYLSLHCDILLQSIIFFLKSFLNNTGKYCLFRCKNIHDVGLDCELWPGIGINFNLSSFLKHQCEIFGKVSDGLVRFIIRVGSRFYLGEDAAAHWRKINFFFGHNCYRRNNRFLTAFQSEGEVWQGNA